MPEKQKKKKWISRREQQRIATRRARYGRDFDKRNAYHASMFTKTTFNSTTGKEAADKRWKEQRAREARERADNGRGTT